MDVSPLAIVQARIGSTRLPRKMLLDLGGHPLIWWAWKAAVDAFGPNNVVVAMPASKENDELEAGLLSSTPFGAIIFRWGGPENDVLGRFFHCAHRYRWNPNSVIVRVTPDDPLKSPEALRRVANGERLSVELGGEAFTLAMLDAAHHKWAPHLHEREHLTYALFKTDPPAAPPGRTWTVDTPADLEAVRKELEA